MEPFYPDHTMSLIRSLASVHEDIANEIFWHNLSHQMAGGKMKIFWALALRPEAKSGDHNT